MSSPKTQPAITNTVEFVSRIISRVVEVDVLLYFTSRMTKGKNQFVDFSKYFSRAARADSWYFTIRLTSVIQSTNTALLSLLSLNNS